MSELPEHLTRPARPPDRTVRYGDDPDQVADVRLPVGGRPRATVVLLHGGFWRPRYDRAHAGSMAAALADAGYLSCSVEYRRTGWPSTLNDVAALTDALPGLLAPATPATVVVGHSAGGHLALWAAARHRLPVSAGRWRRETALPISGVLALAPVCALRRAHELNLGDGAVSAFVGGGPGSHPERYDAADPAGLAPSGLATVILHGLDDVVVPASLSQEYVAGQRRRGAGERDVRLHALPGAGHFDLIDPTSPAWPVLLGTLATFGDRS